ncbi:MAG: hypothetical protein NVSMB9_12360 [Isosphaeraceae bacterium]
MTVITSRADFEKLIVLRMQEAKLLIDQKHWDGAWYLAGYAVEFALKIRIISLVRKSDGFPNKSLFDKFYTHDLSKLLTAAGLEHEMKADAEIDSLWDMITDWSEQSRYEIGRTKKEATDFYEAIEKRVLPWIKSHRQ